MEVWKLIVIGLGLLIVLVGIIMIYDARIITKKIFSYGDQNEGTLGFKIAGFFTMLIGSGIIILL
ncbi:MAG TPA: hypothetical protein PK993_02855 [Clostridia bacterium]|nr:hypothetical protein [Clostridia bacterium]